MSALLEAMLQEAAAICGETPEDMRREAMEAFGALYGWMA